MARNVTTSAIIDGLLKFGAAGGVLAATFVVPNAGVIFGKPLLKYLDTLDERQRKREIQRALYYMKRRGLIALTTEDYEHGLVLTNEGRRRLRRTEFDKLTVDTPEKWDKKWRLVFFDIPEKQREARSALTYKLKLLGFKQLQRSIWVHPFPCRAEVEAIVTTFKVSKYVSYVEATGLDSEKLLMKRFSGILK